MRIRTVKPEWLDDDRLIEAGSDARVLSIALILLADDHGRGRLNHAAASRVFPLSPENFREALARLSGWFAREYEVRGQRYFEIVNWTKHQKVDKPGKPHVPPPEECDSRDSRETPENVRESLAPDLDHDLDPRPLPGVAGEGDEPKTLKQRVRHTLSLAATPGTAHKLAELLSDLHSDPKSGRPYIQPGMCSAADRAIWAKVIEAAARLGDEHKVSTMSVIAGEWVALIALSAAGELPRVGNVVAYFAKRFGSLRESAQQCEAPAVPAREAA